jgi:site-specific recombinase
MQDDDPLAPLVHLIARLRPEDADHGEIATEAVRLAAERLRDSPAEAEAVRAALEAGLASARQEVFYAESGVRSALGFWLELTQRLGHRVLPPVIDPRALQAVLARLFDQADDHLWVAAVPDEDWLALLAAIGVSGGRPEDARLRALLDACRVLSYRLAGAALDRELLHAEPALEAFESPFLAQNARLQPVLAACRDAGEGPAQDDIREVDVLLDQCTRAIERVRRRGRENGVSIRLTYLLARMQQIIQRLEQLMTVLVAADARAPAVRLFKALLRAEQTGHRLLPFVADNVALVARNITESASRHGEHYIAATRSEWWQMARSAAGGGVIIAVMALIKMRLALLHLPPLTEALAYSLNYGLGFVLIHLLGFTVATKQPAMTAAAIAATVEESRPRELDRLSSLVQCVTRTQCIAVLGNVGLALPLACLIAAVWPALFGTPVAPPAKLAGLLQDIHPLQSAALLYAAVAGLGLFLSGLVSGFFDNKARYHHLANRVAQAPHLRRLLGEARAARLGAYLDIHIGAVLGNLFFGFYLGMAGAVSVLTGLPIDIRHVAFSSANLGTAVTSLGLDATRQILPWAVVGVIGIALVNLLVSFSLALYVAMKSRRLGAQQMLRLGQRVLREFLRRPFDFVRPPLM